MIRVSVRALLVALLFACPVLASQQPSAGSPADRKSLEELLAMLRRQRDAYLATLKTQVDGLVTELEEHVSARRAPEIDRVRGELVKLGPEVAPLLVPALDAGVGGTPAEKRRGLEVAKALRELPTSAVTQPLLGLLKTGSQSGRSHALVALATTPEPERVCPVIRRVYDESDGGLREAALEAIATIGCGDSRDILRAALADEDMDVVGTALRALTAARSCESADDVLKLLREKAVAIEQLALVLRYLEACPESVTSKHLQALIAIANEGRVAERTRVEVLRSVPKFEKAVNRDIKKQLQNVAKSPRREVSIEAMVTLTLLGDSRAKRELMRPYDDAVQRNKDWSDAYHDRAAISFRIGEYNDAIRDARKALELRRADPRPENKDTYILLARSYCRAKRLKNAYDLLKNAPITIVQLRTLSGEADFQALKEHSRYGEVFPK